MFWSVLWLDQRPEKFGTFTWEIIFDPKEMKMTMYNLDIVQSVVEAPQVPLHPDSDEAKLRKNWVGRFFKLGGFT